jgi:hypothetical protein
MVTIPYHRVNAFADEPDPEALQAAIQAFLSECRRPAALEVGEEMIPLVPGEYALEVRSGKLCIELWSQNRAISRRILDIERKSTGILDCQIQRFGNKPSRLSFMDLDRPQTEHRKLSGSRQNFAEQFRRMLTRQYPGWEVRTLTTAPDLRRSFSSIYPRAHLIKNRHRIAALACAEPEQENDFFAFALIWMHHIRTTFDAEFTTKLALFLPKGCGNLTVNRLRWMNRDRLSYTIYLFNEHGSAGQADPADLGNLRTSIASELPEPPKLADVVDGPAERWLEHVVRSRIQTIDPFMKPQPVHGQVLTMAGGDRDMIDLLAVRTDGRLCVLELKASEDLQLPIQALDYWMRIAWHARRNELNHLFPGVALQYLAPKLILLAPATQFHSTNAAMLRYFSSLIEVERIGVNSDWREDMRVILRLEGADMPASHRI